VNHHFQPCCPAHASSFRQEVSESNEVRGNPNWAEGKPHLRASTESDIYLFCAQELYFISVLLIAEGIYATEGKQFFQSP